MNAFRRWSIFGAFVMACASAGAGAQSTTDEYRLKAAFVYRFPQFVEWPPAAFSSARTLDLCVLEPNPFGTSLEQLTAGEALAGRPLRVRGVTAGDGLQGCHTLFVGARNAAGAAAVRAVLDRPVLTIGESDEFLEAGGMIALKLVDRRVRFDIDASHAQRAGLRINAQLLNLASRVRGGTP